MVLPPSCERRTNEFSPVITTSWGSTICGSAIVASSWWKRAILPSAPAEFKGFAVALPGARRRRDRQEPRLVGNRPARAEGARLEDRDATALVRVAHGLVANGRHGRAPRERGKGLGRPIVAAVSPRFCVAGKGLRAQIDGARRDPYPEQGVGDRAQRRLGKGAAAQEDPPAPVAELGAGRAAFIGGVEHARVGGRPEARSAGPRRRIAKRRGEEVVEVRRGGRHPR